MKNKCLISVVASVCMLGTVSVMAQEMSSSVEDLYKVSSRANDVMAGDDHSAVADLYKVSTSSDDVVMNNSSENNETIIDEIKQQIGPKAKGCRGQVK